MVLCGRTSNFPSNQLMRTLDRRTEYFHHAPMEGCPTTSWSSFYRAFTLLELLVSIAVLGILMVLTLTIISNTSNLWRSSVGKTDQFLQARTAFTAMTRNIRQATLASHLDYDNPNSPTKYIRKSGLRFLLERSNTAVPGAGTGPRSAIFFAAPLGYNPANPGVQDLLNTIGYFVSFGDDSAGLPPFLPNTQTRARHRYRLFEFKQPSSAFSQYQSANSSLSWFQGDLSKPEYSRPVADNIILLVFEPQQQTSSGAEGIGGDFTYDSTTQDNLLPPMVKVTMVAISEDSARRLADQHGSQAPPLVNPAWFSSASNFEGDMKALEDSLNEARIDYRVFTSTIPLREDTTDEANP